MEHYGALNGLFMTLKWYKGVIHTKVKILSLFAHPLVISNMEQNPPTLKIIGVQYCLESKYFLLGIIEERKIGMKSG